MVWRLLAWTNRAGCWETDPVYLLSVEWVTDPFVLVHAYSDLLGAMLAAMLSLRGVGGLLW